MTTVGQNTPILDPLLAVRLGHLDAADAAMVEDATANQYMFRGFSVMQGLDYSRGLHWTVLCQDPDASTYRIVETLAGADLTPAGVANLAASIDRQFHLEKARLLVAGAAVQGRANQTIALGAKIRMALASLASMAGARGRSTGQESS
jgi:hypothetical protein